MSRAVGVGPNDPESNWAGTHGQHADKVEIYHFVGRGFQERERTGADTKPGDLEGDLEFLLRAIEGRMRARLREIPAEIARETAAAAARFSSLQPRLFPVAVTFLVPRRLA